MKSLASGVAWTTVARILTVLTMLVVGVALARFVGPERIGVLSIALVTAGMAETVFGVGLSRWLITRADATSAERDTAFGGDLVATFVGAAGIALASPIIADVYGAADLPVMISVLAGGSVVAGLGMPFRNVAYSELNFAAVAKSELVGSLLSAVAALVALQFGLGVWAIILREVLRRALNTFILFQVIKWRPGLTGNWKSFRAAFRFSLPLYAVEALGQVASSVDQLIIGKSFSVRELGLYSRGQTLVLLPLQQVTMVAAQILFPTLSRLPKEEVAAGYAKAVSMMQLVTVPAVVMLMVLADDLVILLLGAEWADAAIFIRILAPTVLWRGTSDLLRSLYNSRGRSDLTLRSTSLSRISLIVGVLVGSWFGVIGLAIGNAVGSLAGSLTEHSIARRFLGAPRFLLLRPVLPILVAGLLCGIASFGVQYFLPMSLFRVLVTSLLGGAVFLGALTLGRVEAWQNLVRMARFRRP